MSGLKWEPRIRKLSERSTHFRGGIPYSFRPIRMRLVSDDKIVWETDFRTVVFRRVKL